MVFFPQSMRALTGIQPSGITHWGNLFGSMIPITKLCNEYSGSFFMIADLHALTTMTDPKKLKKESFELALDLLALGVDPEKTIFFRQSDVPQHGELAWILSTITPMGLMERAHSYKDKVAQGLDANVGLFTYPILMASDILLYDIDLVPVGKDQKQHLEIARDLAQKFNHHFGDTFLLPEPKIAEEVAVVPGIDGQKMSKSYGNTIEIFAEEKQLRKQIMRIETDSKTVEEKKDPEGNTIFELYKLFTQKKEQEAMAAQFRAGNFGYGEAKQILFEAANTFLTPLREKRKIIAEDPKHIRKILEEGGEKARIRAKRKMEKVQKKVGLA